MAKRRPNVIPIIEDARNSAKYKMLVSTVDVICADLAQPDEVLSYLVQNYLLIFITILHCMVLYACIEKYSSKTSGR